MPCSTGSMAGQATSSNTCKRNSGHHSNMLVGAAGGLSWPLLPSVLGMWPLASDLHRCKSLYCCPAAIKVWEVLCVCHLSTAAARVSARLSVTDARHTQCQWGAGVTAARTCSFVLLAENTTSYANLTSSLLPAADSRPTPPLPSVPQTALSPRVDSLSLHAYSHIQWSW